MALLAQPIPKRIISLAPSLTDSLCLLGAKDRIVGCTTYCKRKDLIGVPRVGNVREISIEKIVMLKPDVVLATTLTNPKAVAKLRSMGYRVEVFPYPKSFEDICHQFLKLGKIVGATERASSIVKRARREVSRITTLTRSLKKIRVFVEIGANPLFTVTKNTYINDLIEKAGGINIASDSKSGLYSREKVVEKDPDVIIITDMGILTEKEKGFWMKFKEMKAVKNRRIYIVDSYKLCNPTPLSFVESLREITLILHPELAGKI